LFSDAQHVTDQVTTALEGVFLSFAPRGAPGKWCRILEDGQQRNESEAAYVGPNESEPECVRDGQWVFYVDRADNKAIKRVSIEVETGDLDQGSALGLERFPR